MTAYVRKNGSRVLVEALVNFILAFAIYNYTEAPLGEVGALLASSAPPIRWSLVEFARHRRLDALSVFVVSGIALSLLAMLGGGGARFLQLREKLGTGVIGLAFVGSAMIGKPLIYELARASMRRKSEGEVQRFEALQVHAGLRRTMTVMTLVWGLGLVTDVAVSVVLVFVLTIRECLLVNPILGYSTMGALSLWSFLYGQRATRRARRGGRPPPSLRLTQTPTAVLDDFRTFCGCRIHRARQSERPPRVPLSRPLATETGSKLDIGWSPERTSTSGKKEPIGSDRDERFLLKSSLCAVPASREPRKVEQRPIAAISSRPLHRRWHGGQAAMATEATMH